MGNVPMCAECGGCVGVRALGDEVLCNDCYLERPCPCRPKQAQAAKPPAPQRQLLGKAGRLRVEAKPPQSETSATKPETPARSQAAGKHSPSPTEGQLSKHTLGALPPAAEVLLSKATLTPPDRTATEAQSGEMEATADFVVRVVDRSGLSSRRSARLALYDRITELAPQAALQIAYANKAIARSYQKTLAAQARKERRKLRVHCAPSGLVRSYWLDPEPRA